MLRAVPQSCTKPEPPVTKPGLYLRLVPAQAQTARLHFPIVTQGRCKACCMALAQGLCSRLRVLTGFIYLDNAAVGQLFQQAQQVGLIVAQARALVALADAVNADGAAGERGEHQPLPQLLAATEAQHVTYACCCATSADMGAGKPASYWKSNPG